ncbi:MAG: DNA-processing protein DprA [Bacteroidia bacterium]|nr:DNA-processing protein DprA [Bacteroidia bacterium]
MTDQLLYKIALTLIPGIGDVLGKKLVAYCGGPEAVFNEKKRQLEKIPGIGPAALHNLLNHKDFKKAEEEIEFIERNNIQPLFYLDKAYPKRLQHCADSPLMLYYKGNTDLNAAQVVGVVGTRNATEYGRQLCDQLVEGLMQSNVLIVSGLAYGIDTSAHRAALRHALPTVGVLGHGLDRIYPHSNKSLSEKMLNQGGLLTEFTSGTTPDKENFPRRNRIVAGMIDALVVVESGRKGGALITAEIAASYNRDVFAFPGRINDPFSEGCNQLIRTNKAALIRSAEDLIYSMGWDNKVQVQAAQTRLFRDFSHEEQQLLDSFNGEKESGIDDIMLRSGFPASKLAGLLLALEFDGVVTALPGKRYRVNQ